MAAIDYLNNRASMLIPEGVKVKRFVTAVEEFQELDLSSKPDPLHERSLYFVSLTKDDWRNHVLRNMSGKVEMS
jgi:hypothetical protein